MTLNGIPNTPARAEFPFVPSIDQLLPLIPALPAQASEARLRSHIFVSGPGSPILRRMKLRICIVPRAVSAVSMQSHPRPSIYPGVFLSLGPCSDSDGSTLMWQFSTRRNSSFRLLSRLPG